MSDIKKLNCSKKQHLHELTIDFLNNNFTRALWQFKE